MMNMQCIKKYHVNNSVVVPVEYTKWFHITVSRFVSNKCIVNSYSKIF